MSRWQRWIENVKIENGQVGFSQLKTNSIDTSLLKEGMLSQELLELFDRKTVKNGKALWEIQKSWLIS